MSEDKEWIAKVFANLLLEAAPAPNVFSPMLSCMALFGFLKTRSKIRLKINEYLLKHLHCWAYAMLSKCMRSLHDLEAAALHKFTITRLTLFPDTHRRSMLSKICDRNSQIDILYSLCVCASKSLTMFWKKSWVVTCCSFASFKTRRQLSKNRVKYKIYSNFKTTRVLPKRWLIFVNWILQRLTILILKKNDLCTKFFRRQRPILFENRKFLSFL